MNALREEARWIIHRAVNGRVEDVVVFCGSGGVGGVMACACQVGRPYAGAFD
jgi:hypothetical protein